MLHRKPSSPSYRFITGADRNQGAAVGFFRWVGGIVALVGVISVPVIGVEPDTLVATSVQAASPEAQQAIDSFKIDDGLQIELVAAEPQVANIVAMDIDSSGNLYVAETFRQSDGVTDNRAHDQQWLEADLASQTVQDRIDYHRRLLGDAVVTYEQKEDRLRRLSDTDGDGVMDRCTTVADGFRSLEEGTGAGVLVRGNSIYYACIPKLWKFIDKDRDGVADNKVVLSDGYGVRVAFRGHDLHGLTTGPDGRLYFTIGDRGYHITDSNGRTIADPASGAVFRCEMDGSDLTVIATGLRNPQEIAFNDFGDWFSVDNNSDSGDRARTVAILRGADSGWRMHYQYLPDRGVFNRESIWKPLDNDLPNPQSVAVLPPITNFTDGPSGLAYYPGTGFGDRFKDKFLICDFRGGPANSGVRSFEIVPNGAYYKQTVDDQPIWQILATDVLFGPRGGLYVSDWVDGWNGLGKGRIYRLSESIPDTSLIDEVFDLLNSPGTEWTPQELVDRLGHVDRRVRFKAQFELARRDEVSTLSETASAAESPTKPRLHAIWGLGQIARRDKGLASDVAETLQSLVSDTDDEVARAAILSLGDLGMVAAADAIAAAPGVDRPRVQYAVWMALAQLRSDVALSDVAPRLASTGNRDPALRHAAIYYWSRAAVPQSLVALATGQNAFVRRCIIAALRRSQPTSIVGFLIDDDPNVVAEAVRAVHDDGGRVLTGEVIDLANRPTVVDQTDETVRRIINTCDRTRDVASAHALISIAVNQALPTDLRVRAVETFGSWTRPRTIDAYDHTYRPREAVEIESVSGVLQTALQSLISVAGPIKRATIDAASAMGLVEIAADLQQVVLDDNEPAADRAGALSALARLDPSKAETLAAGMVTSTDRELILSSLNVLRRSLPEHIDAVIGLTDSPLPRVAQSAWDALGSSSEPKAIQRVEQAIDRLVQNRLPAAVHLNVLEAAESMNTSLSPAAKRQWTKYRDAMDARTDWRRYATSLVGGDAMNGSKLFHENTKLSCVRCHRVHRSGGAVGPALTVIGAEKTPQYLLESICYPDAAIAKGYETTIIATDDGTVYSGIVAEDGDEFLTLALSDGSNQRIEQDSILARKPGQSSMPGDLMKYMTRRDLRDLVAYLDSLKVDPGLAEGEIE